MRIFIEIDDTQIDIVKEALAAKAGVKKEAEKKEEKKAVTAAAESEGSGEVQEYAAMKAAELYKLCCERGISSKCKKRDKASLIEVLKEYDRNGGADDEEEEVPDDEWPDEEEEKPEDPYVGKKAQELYKMCIDRGIVVKKKLSPEQYVKKLKEADAAADEEDDGDEWNID